MLSTLVMELESGIPGWGAMRKLTPKTRTSTDGWPNIVQGAQGDDVSAPDKVEAVLTDSP